MGFTPQDVQRMTLDEFDACVTGWNRAQGSGPPPELSKDDYAALIGLSDAWNGEADA